MFNYLKISGLIVGIMLGLFVASYLSNHPINWMYEHLDVQLVQQEIIEKTETSKPFEVLLISKKSEYHIRQLRQESDCIYVLYEHQKLLYWTSNELNFEVLPTISTDGLYNLAGRVYLVWIKRAENRILYSLLPLKTNFRIENAFLKNKALSGLSIPDNFLPTAHAGSQKITIPINGKSTRFSFIQTSENKIYPYIYYTLSGLYLLLAALFLIILTRFVLYQNNLNHWLKLLIWTVLYLILFAFVLNTEQIPFSSTYPIFNAFDFANLYISSLGQLFIYVIGFFIWVFIILNFCKTFCIFPRFSSWLIHAGAMLLLILWSIFIENIIQNSTSQFVNFDSVIMRWQDILLLILFGLPILSIIRIQQFAINQQKILKRTDWYVYFGLITVFGLMLYIFQKQLMVVIVLSSLTAFLLHIHQNRPNNKETWRLIIIMLVSFFLTIHILHIANIKDAKQSDLYLEKSKSDYNRLAEYLLHELDHKISSDTELSLLMEQLPGNESDIYQYIRMQYLTGYWSQFLSEITICGSKEIYESPNDLSSCDAFFEHKTQNREKQIEKTQFVSINEGGVSHYLGRFTYKIKNNSIDINLYVFLQANETHKSMGYPSVLLNHEIDLNYQSDRQSFAKYVDGVLVNQQGAYNYSTRFKSNSKDAVYTFEENNYEHLVENVDKHVVNIVSRPKLNFWALVVAFSYIFILYTAIFYSIGFVIKLFNFNTKVQNTSLKDKLRWSFIGVLSVSFVLTATAILYKSTEISENKEQHLLNEKMQSILVEIKHKFSENNTINTNNANYYNYLLTKFSYVFFSDINLYDLNGKILASSRPEIFEKDLIGNQMHPEAYEHMHFKNESEFLHHEQLGEQNYLSAYIPVRDSKNVTVAYLNLPFFARNNEIQRDIKDLITAFLNLFIILFIITGVFTVFISSRITSPLSIIQQKLKTFSLDQPNEPIAYQSKDEIGDLVKQYNLMAEELNKNIALLAQKEREGAWKEMAKQIAHEIKNPLTPMKLSLQHLQYIWNSDKPDKNEKVISTTELVIKQIDRLAEIASAFSDFSKMTQSNRKPMELWPLIIETAELYHNEIEIIFDAQLNQKALILGDEKQVSRVLQNLITNAIQAAHPERKPALTIRLMALEPSWRLSLCDNGMGIEAQVMEHIFEPNFTTKTSGMGLGLAIVKQIIDHHNGKIYIESIPEKGTCITIDWPIFEG